MPTRPPISELLDSERPGRHPKIGIPVGRASRAFSFVIEDAPPTAGTAERIGHEIRLLQTVEGRVTQVNPGAIELSGQHGFSRVLISLPPAITLVPLLGSDIQMRIAHRYGALATMDTQIRCAESGRLVFWARDGQWPGGPPDGFSVAPIDGGLSFRAGKTEARVPVKERRAVSFGRANWALAVFHSSDERCVFALARRALN